MPYPVSFMSGSSIYSPRKEGKKVAFCHKQSLPAMLPNKM